jgi:hypothetical protein
MDGRDTRALGRLQWRNMQTTNSARSPRVRNDRVHPLVIRILADFACWVDQAHRETVSVPLCSHAVNVSVLYRCVRASPYSPEPSGVNNTESKRLQPSGGVYENLIVHSWADHCIGSFGQRLPAPNATLLPRTSILHAPTEPSTRIVRAVWRTNPTRAPSARVLVAREQLNPCKRAPPSFRRLPLKPAPRAPVVRVQLVTPNPTLPPVGQKPLVTPAPNYRRPGSQSPPLVTTPTPWRLASSERDAESAVSRYGRSGRRSRRRRPPAGAACWAGSADDNRSCVTGQKIRSDRYAGFARVSSEARLIPR